MWTSRQWWTRYAPALAVTALAILGSGCSDAGGPDLRSETDLQVLHLRPGAPPLEETSASFYAKKGEARDVSLYFTDGGSGRGARYFHLQVGANSLGTLPDGSPIAAGDSVLITVQVVDPTELLFELQPSGLRFNAAAPAELSVSYAQVDHDFNGDGTQDLADQAIELQLTIWRQETLGALFQRLVSLVSTQNEEVSASISGFTRYAVSY